MSAAATGGPSTAALAAEAGARARLSGLQMARHIVQVGSPEHRHISA